MVYRTANAQNLYDYYLVKCQPFTSELVKSQRVPMDDIQGKGIESDGDIERLFFSARNEIISDLNTLDRCIVDYYLLQEQFPQLERKRAVAKNNHEDFLKNNQVSEAEQKIRHDFHVKSTSIQKSRTISQDTRAKKLKKLNDELVEALAEQYNPELDRINAHLYTAFYQADYDRASMVINLNKMDQDIPRLHNEISEKIDSLSCQIINALTHKKSVRFFQDSNKMAPVDHAIADETQHKKNTL